MAAHSTDSGSGAEAEGSAWGHSVQEEPKASVTSVPPCLAPLGPALAFQTVPSPPHILLGHWGRRGSDQPEGLRELP